MNMQTAIEQAPPFEIGQGYSDRYGRTWVVKIEPVDTQGGLIRRQCLVIGGPAPMAEIRWNIQTVNDRGAISTIDEHTLSRLVREHPIPACPNPAALLADAIEKQEAARAMQRKREAETAAALDVARAELEQYRPAWASSAIIAELHHDDSDIMTDYHNHKTSRVVVLAWSKHDRDIFSEMRKAAALFPETADLADAPESAEHREKYSMGAGYYLKRGWRDSSGWCVKKTRVKWLDIAGLEFTDAAKGIKPAAPIVGTATPTPTDGASNAAGLFAISQHVHTRKGFAMWICELRERVEREDFDRFLQAAKALGGWYSRPWGGTPGGFAFKSEAAALQFIGAEGPAPTDGNGKGEPAAKPAPIPAANPAEKLRAMADAMQAAIEGKFADRRANTPKRQYQAAIARQDGAEMERAQKIMRALADAHDAGTVPACLRLVTTKAAILRLAKEKIDRGRAGYYDAGFPTGKPYAWRDAHDVEQAAAAWALLDGAGDAARREAEALRQKIDGLKFAKIPGYFPTPATLVARMIEAADLAPGSRVLEPSAGSGAIADAVKAAGHSVECIERHASLCEIIAAKGHSLIRGDFLELSPAGLYDAAVMNPPFESAQDLQHVRHAWEWIKPGGALVAIMGAGVTFRQDRRYSDFRAWAEGVGGEFEPVPAGTFKESGTGVASVMLTLRKPAD